MFNSTGRKSATDPKLAERAGDEVVKYKKVKHEHLEKEDFKRKEYLYQLDLEQIRDKFKLQSQM